MSWHVQPVGQRLGGGAAELVRETVSNVSVPSAALFELTTSPATIAPPEPKVTLEPTRTDQLTPSVEVNVVNVFPDLVICT